MNKSVMSLEKKTIEKAAASSNSKLVNWMPGRGGDPGDMPSEPKLTIPKLKIEMLPANAPRMKPVVVQGAPRPAKHRKGERFTLRDYRQGIDSQRKWVYGTWCQVTDALQLSPWLADRMIQGIHRNKLGRRASCPSGELPDRTITVDLQYPLSHTARVTIAPFAFVWPQENGGYHVRENTQMSLGYVLWTLAKAYKKIYSQPDKWGIWGHAISDLGFEGFSLQDNVGDVSIGS